MYSDGVEKVEVVTSVIYTPIKKTAGALQSARSLDIPSKLPDGTISTFPPISLKHIFRNIKCNIRVLWTKVLKSKLKAISNKWYLKSNYGSSIIHWNANSVISNTLTRNLLNSKVIKCYLLEFFSLTKARLELSQRRSLNLLSTNQPPTTTQTFEALPGKLWNWFSLCSLTIT